MRSISPLLLICLSFAEQSLSATCSKDSQKLSVGYVIGKGVGESFEEAKSKATADALKFFGTKVSTEETVQSDNDGVYVTGSVTTTLSSIAQGVEVLSECTISQDKVRVIVGMRKSTIQKLIELRARSRQESASSLSKVSTTKDKVALKKIQAEDAKDREVWALIGRPDSLYPAVINSSLQSVQSETYHIVASGEIAVATLPEITAKLSGLGYKFAGDGEEVIWQCTLVTGSPVGDSVQYKIDCRLTQDLGLEPIFYRGTTRLSDLESRVKQVIINKISEEK